MNTKTVKEKLYKIMENSFPSSSKYFINLVIDKIDKLYRKEMLKEVKKLIICNECNGVGGYLGDSLGYCECNQCGGDGHNISGREGDKLNEILDEVKQSLL